VTDDDKTIGMTTNNFDFTYSPAQFWNRMDKNTVQEYLFGEGSTPDGSHQMKECTQSGGALVNCSFDAAGNMASFGSTRTYGYDYQNQLAYAKDSSGTITEYWYRYDPFGRRIEEKRLVSGSSTYKLFYYDGPNIVEETDGSQNLSSLNGLRIFENDLNEVLYSGTITGGSLASHRWPCEDSLGSIVTVYDDTATMKSDLAYTLFGETTRSGAEDYPYGYARLMYNSEMSLYHSLTRVYKPEYGRWIQRDFIGSWGDEGNFGNGYAYVANDPLNRNDPSGKVLPAIAGAAAAAAAIGEAIAPYVAGAALALLGALGLGGDAAVGLDPVPDPIGDPVPDPVPDPDPPPEPDPPSPPQPPKCPPCPAPPPPQIHCVPPSAPHFPCTPPFEHHYHYFVYHQSPPPKCICRLEREFGGCLAICPISMLDQAGRERFLNKMKNALGIDNDSTPPSMLSSGQLR
jgi:RHS repeat-associated protein